MRVFLLLIGWCLMTSNAAAAVDVQVVQSPGGITAWLSQDHTVPVISMQFAFRGGTVLDGDAQAGLANLVASTLDEGAGNLRAAAFHEALEDQSIYLSYSASRDELRGSVKTLTANAEDAWRLLTLSLVRPRFDAKEVERVKEQIISDITHSYSDPKWAAMRSMNDIIYAGHPYHNPGQGYVHTVKKIMPDDLRAWTRARMARDQLVVAVSGDITPTDLAELLDKVFGQLPPTAEQQPLSPVVLQGGGKDFVVERDLPQTRLLMVQPLLPRNDPDWYAAAIMNYTLGGGGFNSRLMLEVREKRGLTYGVDTQMLHYNHANVMMVSAATANSTAAEAVALIKSEWARMRDDGITVDELKDAQTYLTGALPLALTSTDQIASFLLQVQLQGLGKDYVGQRNDLFWAVTVEDVARVAKKWLRPEAMTLVAVGAPDDLASAVKIVDPAKTGLQNDQP